MRAGFLLGGVFAGLLMTVVSRSVEGGEPRFEAIPRRPELKLAAGAPGGKVLAERDGIQLVSVSPTEVGRIQSLIEEFRRRRGDGGGADVADLLVVQTQFLDSQCRTADCNGDGVITDVDVCNVVLILWIENTPNGHPQDGFGVDVLLDGALLGTLAGRDPTDQSLDPFNQTGFSFPAPNGIRITNVTAGPHTFRVESRDDGSFQSGDIEVLDQQPFADPENLRCEGGQVLQGGTCALTVRWDNPGPLPGNYAVTINGFLQGPLLGTETSATYCLELNASGECVLGVDPGEYTITLQAVDDFGAPRYQGCEVTTQCTLVCEDLPCNPPVSLEVCQTAYGPDTENEVIATWTNGELPYAEGVSALVDGRSVSTLGNDPNTGESADLASLGGLAPGEHTIGIQGDCGGGELSAVTEATITLLPETPHPNPVEGGVLSCEFNPQQGETTATWTSADPSNFIHVFVESGGNRVFLGRTPGTINTVTVGNTTEEDEIVLQFFVQRDGQCYGSEMVGCQPTGTPFIRGVCGLLDDNPQISSAIGVFNFLFQGGARPGCLEACDADAQGGLNITDGIYILNYLFLGGDAPVGWQDPDGNGVLDPTCEFATPEQDCETANPNCAP